MPFSMETVETASLLNGSVRISDFNNVNPTWRSPIRTHAGDTVAYLKWIGSGRELFVEIVCAVIGRGIGLPIPKPYLVLATSDTLPDGPWQGENARVLLGSEDAGHPSFRRFLQPSYELAIQKLMQWEKFKLAGCFDEWIANPDRHASNILYDGDGSFWLIDHGLALPIGLLANEHVRNILLDATNGVLDDLGRARLKRFITKEAAQYAEIGWELVPAKARCHIYASDEDVQNVINFLRERVEFLLPLVAQRLGQRQIGVA